MDKIVATLKDYFGDYKYLKPRNLERIIMMARDRVAKKYLSMVMNPSTSILSLRKQRFDTEAERKDAADKVRKEAAQLKRCFREIGGECGAETDLEFDSPFIAIGRIYFWTQSFLVIVHSVPITIDASLFPVDSVFLGTACLTWLKFFKALKICTKLKSSSRLFFADLSKIMQQEKLVCKKVSIEQIFVHAKSVQLFLRKQSSILIARHLF